MRRVFRPDIVALLSRWNGLDHSSRIAQHRADAFSAPVLATILILFGIGYTIDYNSESELPFDFSLSHLGGVITPQNL